jgi:hypothetical protein
MLKTSGREKCFTGWWKPREKREGGA